MSRKPRPPAKSSWTGQVETAAMDVIPEDTEASHGNNNGHSLPLPDEMETPRSSKRIYWVVAISVLVIIAVISIGLAFGLKDEKNQQNEIVNAGSARDVVSDKKRRIRLQQYLVKHEVNTDAEFEDRSSPHFRALDFLAFQDEQRLSAPSGDLRSREGYGLLTRYVMSLFFYQMGGPDWNFDLMFLSKFDTCYWFSVFKPPIGQVGIICNENTNEITGFSFIGDNLIGELPKEIAHLTTLSYIESIGNQVKGSIPDEYQNLTNLRTLVFAWNTMSGPIPTWIDRLGRLEFFYLSNNLFSGTIPSQLERLTNLRVLALNDNTLDGSIDSVWTLPKLEYLFMEGNEFTGQLPGLLSEYTPQLINLDFSSNTLSGVLPEDVFSLANLEILDLHGNGFIGPIPDAAISSSSSMLEFVALYENALTGTIPPSLSNLRKLRHLDLSSNALTGEIPDYLFTLGDLKELSLKRTQRSGSVSSLIGSLVNLVVLDLDNNEFTGAIPSEIGALADLQFLLLNRNKLNDAVPSEMSNLTSLRMALLNTNNVTGSMAPICQIQTMQVAVSDCLETSCECCTTCCTSNENCHDYEEVARYDPSWETNYQRTFFSFSKFEQFSVPEVRGNDDN
eukprot:scaffold22611_cov153-Cylindrotheca_fusiformis.AAC.1